MGQLGIKKLKSEDELLARDFHPELRVWLFPLGRILFPVPLGAFVYQSSMNPCYQKVVAIPYREIAHSYLCNFPLLGVFTLM